MIPTREMKKMRAFHNKPDLKKAMIAELKWHEKQDKIVKGTYGSEDNAEWRGCAVGCSIHSLNRKYGKSLDTSNHKVYESELGIPETIAYLEDSLFENMPQDDAMKFPRKIIEAIPVGADLSLVPAKFIVFVLNDVLQYADELGSAAIRTIIGLWADVIAGKKVKDAAWSAAESAARSAASAARSAAESAASAAWSAAWSAAESAASAARSAASAAESAAWSAAWSAAESAASAAESAAYVKYANYLIKILKSSK